MNNSLKLAVSAISAAAILGSASANATVFSFDEFYINKNGSEIFRDSFSDGVAPGSGPDDGILGPGNTYTVFGGGFSEPGTGKLLVDSAAGGLTSNPNGDARLFNRIRRNRSTNPVSSAHLGAGDSWSINGLLDLSTLPANPGEAFGIRAEDNSGSSGTSGNDRVLLSVRRSNASGTLGVHFGALNFNGVPIETFDFFDLDPLLTALPSADQIGLSITHDIGTNAVNGSFSLFSSGSLLVKLGLDNVGDTSLLNAQLYSDEGFTRAALYTIENAEIQVPEPGMVALLGAGVMGIAFVRRSKSK